MTKTIMILAIAAAFMVGTTMSFVVSDFEAEAKPKDPKPPFIDPILKPINATLLEIQAQLADIQVVVDETQAKQDLLDDAIAEVAEGVDETNAKQDLLGPVVDAIATNVVDIKEGIGTSP